MGSNGGDNASCMAIPARFNVTPVAGTGGHLTPDTPQSVSAGETATFTVAAEPNDILDRVEGCDGALGEAGGYVTGPIKADCSVTASFLPIGIEVVESDGFSQVSEAGGTDQLFVTLTAQPLSNVRIQIESLNTDEAAIRPTWLDFTDQNWNVPQAVTVTGVDDHFIDGSQETGIEASVLDEGSDPLFWDAAQSITVTTTDDDRPGFSVSETDGTTEVTESGGFDSLSVSLDAQPKSPVMIDVAGSDSGEASASPLRVTFTTADWNTPQTVQVAGVDDTARDGDQQSALSFRVDGASDPDFVGLDSQSLAVTTHDDDQPGLLAEPLAGLVTDELQKYEVILGSPTSTDRGYAKLAPVMVQLTNRDNDGSAQPAIRVKPASGLVTSEAGAQTTVRVWLATRPQQTVLLGVRSDDIGEGKAGPATLVFTPDTWKTAQTITVIGVDDRIKDGPQAYHLILDQARSVDPGYHSLPPVTVPATNQDNEK